MKQGTGYRGALGRARGRRRRGAAHHLPLPSPPPRGRSRPSRKPRVRLPAAVYAKLLSSDAWISLAFSLMGALMPSAPAEGGVAAEVNAQVAGRSARLAGHQCVCGVCVCV